jgi:hypothetical protein
MPHDQFDSSQDVNAHTLLGRGHACAIVHGSDDELEWLLPMVDELTPQAVRTIRIVDQVHAEHETSRLAAWREGHPIVGRNEMRVTDWQRTYLVGGEFQQRAMLSRIGGFIDDGHSDGFPLVRIVADMTWAAGDVIGVDDLFEYESRLNTVIDPVGAVVVCVYDLAAFSRGVVGGLRRPASNLGAGFLLDVIRAHPFVITDRQLRANRFYAPPESFLPEIAARRGPGSTQ